MIRGLAISVRRVLTGDMTLKQALIFSKMRLFNTQKELNDDFDWSQYHLHYREELKVIGRTATLLPSPGQFRFESGELRQLDAAVKPLHPNHHLLYEVVLGLEPRSLLEIGCGGGDHLRNFAMLAPSILINGVDRSREQLATLRERHPGLKANLEIHDITQPATVLPSVDLVFSQTVLMHISETQGRLANALDNVLKAAGRFVVMVEDWTEHDFLMHVQEAIKRSPEWRDATLHYTFRAAQPSVRALIVSKTPLAYPRLETYDSLLQGRALQIH